MGKNGFLFPEEFREVIHVTPQMAEEMLKKNKRNRIISASHVAFIAGEIRSGRWAYNGQPIVFSPNDVVSFSRLAKAFSATIRAQVASCTANDERDAEQDGQSDARRDRGGRKFGPLSNPSSAPCRAMRW